ncbi:lamin tail domain-containing protein [Chryseosolibacter indicus]|uniref:Lamin tail domain-containing protein n=1 Tax=Chryseosolibacter indicus TaxID=2782351 RepID=A0ABS5VNS5_9BACT|nr:lamin tail domain-containing protein [Chryseosolibacter indicus]MBT1703110.1 lamin tail domain-containing protein [Chryseosolibacter indicus]
MYISFIKSLESLQFFLLTATLTSIVSIGICTSQQAFAQVSDSFDDGNFTSNPIWTGADGKNDFKVESNQLQLDAPAVEAVSYLSTLSNVINHTIWEFNVKMTFETSSNNLTRVYLISDQQNLSGAIKGYYVEIGNTLDEVSLYRQSGVTAGEKIIDGADARVRQSTVTLKVKVTRDNIGTWRLYTDVGITGTYTLEGSVIDSTYLTSKYFGIYCKYIASRSKQFFFDNFNVSIDKSPPQLLTANPTSNKTLLLTFSEELDPSSASNLNNYSIDGLGNPSHVELINGSTVGLTFNREFRNGAESTIKVSGVQDIAANVAEISKVFFYFQPLPVSYRDIRITEIFSDPNPTVGLPEAEFIELYNRSKNPINLKGWKITDGSSTGTLADKILLPSEYLIICASTSSSLFGSYGYVMGVSNFPTLNNAGDAIVIRNSEGLKIDSVNYLLKWFQNEDKREGGWTLELIDPENNCTEETNWTPSESETGGTPGKVNSVFANKPDLTPPQLISVIPLSEKKLLLSFDEKLDTSVPPTAAFWVKDTDVSSVAFTDNSFSKIELLLSSDLEKGKLYSVTVANIFDCAGNEIERNNSLSFGLPEEISASDIVINEILFNPRPGGVDFIELYNRSSKYLNLKNLVIANIVDDHLDKTRAISPIDKLVSPGEYLVLTTDAEILKNEYPRARQETFVEVNILPSMNDDEGSIAIADTLGAVVDQISYTDKMHSMFVKDNDGVSLERISVNTPTSNNANWKSASSASGFATPGYVNSNTVRGEYLEEDVIKVIPEIFLPLSGQTDFAQINYRFDKGGYVANVKIYSPQGVEIKTIAENEILSSEGFLRWDGDTDKGTKANVGAYLIYFEVFDDEGQVKTFKKRVAIAGRF